MSAWSSLLSVAQRNCASTWGDHTAVWPLLVPLTTNGTLPQGNTLIWLITHALHQSLLTTCFHLPFNSAVHDIILLETPYVWDNQHLYSSIVFTSQLDLEQPFLVCISSFIGLSAFQEGSIKMPPEHTGKLFWLLCLNFLAMLCSPFLCINSFCLWIGKPSLVHAELLQYSKTSIYLVQATAGLCETSTNWGCRVTSKIPNVGIMSTFLPPCSSCILDCRRGGSTCPPGVNYAHILAFKTASLPAGIHANQDLVRLMAYDQVGNLVPQTLFTIIENETGTWVSLRSALFISI